MINILYRAIIELYPLFFSVVKLKDIASIAQIWFFNALYLLVKATRISDEATVILVTWSVTDPLVTTVSLEIQEGGEGQWQLVAGASGLSASTTEFKVTDLKADKSYRLRMDMRRPGEQNPVYVFSESGKGATL